MSGLAPFAPAIVAVPLAAGLAYRSSRLPVVATPQAAHDLPGAAPQSQHWRPAGEQHDQQIQAAQANAETIARYRRTDLRDALPWVRSLEGKLVNVSDAELLSKEVDILLVDAQQATQAYEYEIRYCQDLLDSSKDQTAYAKQQLQSNVWFKSTAKDIIAWYRSAAAHRQWLAQRRAQLEEARATVKEVNALSAALRGLASSGCARLPLLSSYRYASLQGTAKASDADRPTARSGRFCAACEVYKGV